MNDPSISVIIAVKNGQETIRKCLDSVLALPNKDIEIIVVDDGSCDDTEKVLEGYGALIFVMRNPQSIGPAESRNIAVVKARGAMVAFTDADCIVHPDWLNELKQCFADDTVASAGGAQQPPSDESRFGRRVSSFLSKAGFVSEYSRFQAGQIRLVRHNPSCNSMYRKEVFLDVGGFWKGFWPGEDVDLDHRLHMNGYKICFNPRAVVYHYRTKTFSGFCKMMRRYGWAQGVLVRRHGVTRAVQWAPIIFLVWLFTGLLNIHAFLILAVAAVAVLFIISKADMWFMCLGTAAFFCWNVGFMKGVFSWLEKK